MSSGCCPPRPLTVRYAKAAASIGVGPAGPPGADGAPGAPGFSIPAPYLIATGNITLTGVVTVDGVSSADAVAAGKDILAPYQTTAADRAYWTPNNSGAWTLADYYNSNAEVAAARGQLSGAALAGTLNKGKRFYAFSGDTVAGAKVWYPAVAGAEINVADAPWYWLGDGANRETEKSALQAYMATLSAAGIGGKITGLGVFAYTSPLKFPKYWAPDGCGPAATEWRLLSAGNEPRDSMRFPKVFNLGAVGFFEAGRCKVSNPWGQGFAAVWSGGATYADGQYVYPTRASNVILKCKGTPTSATGAFEPIGELSNGASIKSVGTSNAAAQTLLIPTVAGYLGGFAFKLSVDAGITQSAVQTTSDPTGEGDPQTFIVDTVLGGSTYGTTYGFQILNNYYPTAVHTVGAGGFVQPAVFTTASPASVNVLVDSSAGFGPGQYVLGSTGGLWMVVGSPDPTHVTLWNIGAAGAATPGVTIPAGTTLTLCYAPAPRIEVIGTPPATAWTVDVQTVGGPLGSAACQYQYGQGGGAEKWKSGLTVPQGSFTNTTGGAGTWTSGNLNVPGATNLQLRFHTGLAYNSGTWSYFTPSQTWSEQVGTDIVDGGHTWTVFAGTACLNMTAYFATFADMILDGGTIGIKLDQCEDVVLHGSWSYQNQRTANIYVTGGSITNSVTLEGTHAFFGGFVSFICDSSLSLNLTGAVTCQGGLNNSMYLAGAIGVNLSGIYLEGYGFVARNCEYFSRLGTGISVNSIEIGGSYLGSAAGAYSLDFHAVSGASIHGVALGGATGIIGMSSCTNINVDSCSVQFGQNTFDVFPLSGQGLVYQDGKFQAYQRSDYINSTTPNRTVAGTTDTALLTDNCGNVTCTSGSAVTVTVPSLAAGTVVTYEQGGAGALSFSASGVTIQTALASSGATSGQYQARTLFWKDATHVRIT